jgi:choline transport protein
VGNGQGRGSAVFPTVSQNSFLRDKRNKQTLTAPSHTRSLSLVNPTFNVPINAILAVATFNILFGLLYLGPSVAFNAYISSCTIFLNCSYAGPILILLIRGRKTITDERPDFPLGRVGGHVANWIAVVYVGVTSVVCFCGVGG